MKNNISIIQGDALELLKNVNDESIDLIVVDPPYNLGKNYGNDSDNMEFKEYLKFSNQWLRQAKRVLKKTGSIYVFMGVRFIPYIYNLRKKTENAF
jgi:site-specific DNA-methyltransferase (adenine-specific)